MARARNIKPGFFKDEDLIEVSFAARLLFAGLWTLADRRGVTEDRPKRIKMELFPADDLDVDALLTELAGIGSLVRYESEGRRGIWIPGFQKHQKPHPKEPESDLPLPDGVEPCKETASRDETRLTALNAECLTPESLNEEGAPKPGRGTRIPDDFGLTDQRQEVARRQGLADSEAQSEAEKFVDYWRSQPGARGRKADWDATWRNWCRRAVEYRGRKPGEKQREEVSLDDASPI